MELKKLASGKMLNKTFYGMKNSKVLQTLGKRNMGSSHIEKKMLDGDGLTMVKKKRMVNTLGG